MTVADFAAFIDAARAAKVQEFSIGDTHVLFSPAALVPLVAPAIIEPKAALASSGLPEDEAEVKKLMDDPDLFLASDGPHPVPQ